MAWDITQPTDTTKIRNLGVVIRPNWVAIQQADSTFKPWALNFTNRTVAGIAVDPTAIASAYILYSKTDTAGNTELFGINPLSNVIQMTKGAPVVAQTGRTFLPGGLILAWGSLNVASGGSVTVTGITTLYSVVVTRDTFTAGVTQVGVNSMSGSSFTVIGPNSPIEIHYVAIGV